MFRVVLADPPWRFQVRSEGSPKLAQSHYKCMNPSELVAYRGEFDHLLAPDCVLVMWTTWPMLAAGRAHGWVSMGDQIDKFTFDKASISLDLQPVTATILSP